MKKTKIIVNNRVTSKIDTELFEFYSWLCFNNIKWSSSNFASNIKRI